MTNPPARLDLGRYAPFLLTNIANRWTTTASRRYLRDFGIGVTEWRVLAALAEFGSATSLDVVNLIGMDAAAVSRAMRVLGEAGHVAPVAGRFRGRSKPFALTPAGEGIYLRIRDDAFAREDLLLAALTAQERDTLLDLLGKVHATLADL